jgi:alkylation response protein AidB-like acyl-CoA dehydrogenase
MADDLGEALGADFFTVRDQFTDEVWDRFIATRRFVDTEVLPVAADYWERAELAWPLVRRLPELGIVGEDIKGYGAAEMSPMACGLVHMELHRGDGSLGTFLGVHAGLAMQAIAMCGSEEQKARWLPRMSTMEQIGAFALTEPDHGSDSIALATSARRDGDHWVLEGEKRWIGNGTITDLVVVWARYTEDGQVKGFVVETPAEGLRGERDDRQAVAARGLAGRHPAARRAGARREPPGGGAQLPRHRPRAGHHPLDVRVDGARPRDRWLRRRADLRQAPHTVRQTAGVNITGVGAFT